MSSRYRARSGSPFEDSIGFSRALRSGDRILVSGTAPVPPPGGELAPDAASQMQRCCEIAVGALRELGGDVDDVVRTRIYLVDAADAALVGEVHRTVFGKTAPAATMLVVAALLDPGWLVEIEVEAEVSRPVA